MAGAVGATDQTGAPAGPQLSITVDNGRTSTAVGDTVDYRITIQNLGVTDVDGLSVTQSVPTGLAFDSADAAGTAGAGGVDWDLDLKATQSATFHTTMTVVATSDDLLRLATVACASIPAGPPIVCASDSDQLPAGASADAAAAALAGDDVSTPMSGVSSRWYLGGGIGVVVVVAALTILLVRRRATPPGI